MRIAVTTGVTLKLLVCTVEPPVISSVTATKCYRDRFKVHRRAHELRADAGVGRQSTYQDGRSDRRSPGPHGGPDARALYETDHYWPGIARTARTRSCSKRLWRRWRGPS